MHRKAFCGPVSSNIPVMGSRSIAIGTLVTPSTLLIKRLPSVGRYLLSGHKTAQALLASEVPLVLA